VTALFVLQECQKDAWAKYHKNECKILKEAPRLRSQHLLAYRLTFWRLQKRVPSELLKVISFLQTHFYDFVKDSKRGADITEVALAIQNATGGKASLGLLWKIVPAVCLIFMTKSPSTGVSCSSLCSSKSTASGFAPQETIAASALPSIW